MQFVKNLLIANKQNKYRPHIIRRHGLALALILVVVLQLAYSIQLSASGSVLGYATNITQTDLLGYTNNNRTANGLPILSMNAKLSEAAQNKANDMIANDYWAHVSPSGVTPWYWFDKAGYAYLVAGENLAYGFDTSLGVVNGWMASPSHRDNILLPEYEEVGFGIASGPNYQGGENTVVVAMYGDPVSSTTPIPAPIAKAETEQEENPTPAKIDEPAGAAAPLTLTSSENDKITTLEALLNGSAGWAMYATVSILILLSFAYLYRHIAYVNLVIKEGEQIIAAHPLLESSLIIIALWLLLGASVGNIL